MLNVNTVKYCNTVPFPHLNNHYCNIIFDRFKTKCIFLQLKCFGWHTDWVHLLKLKAWPMNFASLLHPYSSLLPKLKGSIFSIVSWLLLAESRVPYISLELLSSFKSSLLNLFCLIFLLNSFFFFCNAITAITIDLFLQVLFPSREVSKCVSLSFL